MKRLQSSNARSRSRFSRSASFASPRGKLHGWKTSIGVILGATLLLVSVFYLQARLGGFGSVASGSKSGGGEEEDDRWAEVRRDGGAAQKIKSLARKVSAEAESRGKKLDLTDLEEDEDGEFERLDRAKVDQEIDEEDMDVDESVIEDVDVLPQDHESRREEEEEEDLDGGEGEQQQQQQLDDEVSGGDEDDDGDDELVGGVAAKNKTEKRLERLGQIKSVPRYSPEATNGNETKRAVWDSVLGVIKMPVDANPNSARKLGLGRSKDRAGVDFSSDDEPLDTSQLVDFEEALFSRKDKLSSSKFIAGSSQKQQKPPPKNVFDASFAKRALVRPPPVDPTANALLQDPDTAEPWGLTKSDRAISRSFRKSAMEEERGGGVDEREKVAEGKGKRRKELLEVAEAKKKGMRRRRKRARGDERRWGYFPGLDRSLLFSEFLDAFLRQDECEMTVFQAWNSPPWSYTVRHQRGLESLFHFHPRACVVVFSETIELDFFDKFAKRGLRVAVVRPNLEELLEGTSAAMFASVWVEWRRIDLFYIHYSELLRLAALYKYGGIYLDCDVVVLKPLQSLHNALGMESLTDGKRRLNGAVMAFSKASAFIKECLDEYTATYDDKLLDFNGADLLTRVAKRPIDGGSNQTWEENEQELRILPSSSFFPLSSSNITSYFSGAARISESYSDRRRELESLLEGSYTLHLWNRETKSLIPESGSVVGMALEQHCIWCSDLI